MRMKKGIITIATIGVVTLGVIFAVRFIGNGEIATNTQVKKDNIVKVDTSLSKNNSIAVTNEDGESSVNSNVAKKEAIETTGSSTIDMDAAYINDKTTVGIYTVQKDDTVFSIVKMYMPNHDKSKTLEFIKNRNDIGNSYNIKEGQKIIIPYEKEIQTSKTVDSKASSTKYTVKKEDTLTSIAKTNMSTYNVKQAIEMIKTENKITDENDIREGALIYIPK